MSQKLEIQWDNSNPVFESVRIYKSATAFTANNLPALLTEITDIGVSIYDDLDVELNETWFYMLSTKLGIVEVFTECFEVLIVDDVKNTLNIQYVFLNQAINTSWNSDTGEFRVHKGSISPTADTNSAKFYADPYRKSADGNFYYELICKQVLNISGESQQTYLEDNCFGLMQKGASVNINSTGSNSGVYFSNEGYGRYILRNHVASNSIQAVGGNLTTGGTWVSKVASEQLKLNDIWGIGIKSNGSNTQVHLWINGVYKGVMFTIAGTSIELRPLIIFKLDGSTQKSTYYLCPRMLSFLPDGYQSWLTAS